jgi:hypothetical protein
VEYTTIGHAAPETEGVDEETTEQSTLPAINNDVKVDNDNLDVDHDDAEVDDDNNLDADHETTHHSTSVESTTSLGRSGLRHIHWWLMSCTW